MSSQENIENWWSKKYHFRNHFNTNRAWQRSQALKNYFRFVRVATSSSTACFYSLLEVGLWADLFNRSLFYHLWVNRALMIKYYFTLQKSQKHLFYVMWTVQFQSFLQFSLYGQWLGGRPFWLITEVKQCCVIRFWDGWPSHLAFEKLVGPGVGAQ